jgi:hypothetical protein
MYSRFTKFYDRKTVGHVFTKSLHIEGTTDFSPRKIFFNVVYISAAGCLCKQKSSGRPLTAEDDAAQARASFLHIPEKSTETAAKELSIPFDSIPLRYVLWCSWYKCM